MRHFSVGLVDGGGVEVSSRPELMTRKAANQQIPSLRRRAERQARRSGAPMSIEVTEHLGSCRGCSSTTGLAPGCEVVDRQRVER